MSTPGKLAGHVSLVLGFLIAVHAVHAAWAGLYDITYTRALIVYAAVLSGLLAQPLAARLPSRAPAWAAPLAHGVDATMAVVLTVAIWVFLDAAENLNNMLFSYGTPEIAAALGGIGVLLEVTRRLFGLPLFLFILVVLGYGLFGAHLPAPLAHSGFTLSASMEMVWYGFQGVYGTPLGIVIQVVLIFIVFGVMLEATGASNVLIRIAFAITGGARGGVANSAVVASGMFGSMSGSVVANVVGTGTFTIPMMIRRGLRRRMAGAIEATASTGGQIMPPVMGAAAFLMADLLGRPYLEIAIAALVPALLYYGALFLAISLEAGRSGMQPIPRAERPTIDADTALKSLTFLLPIVVIVAVLMLGRSPAMAGFWAVVCVVVCGLTLMPEVRRQPWLLLAALARGGQAGATIVVAVAAIGIILGIFNLTGVGLSFASSVAALGRDNLVLALLLTAGACLLLGMGMPTLPAYLIIVLVMGRSLRQLGIDPLAVHLFVFYFGVLSAITPPVAVAIFAAAPISRSNPVTTGIAALRLAFAGFLIPFFFVLEPSLLLVTDGFDPTRFAVAVLGLAASIWGLSTAFAGYDGVTLGPLRRAARFALGLLPIAAMLLAWRMELVAPVVALLFAADAVAVRRAQRPAAPARTHETIAK